MLSGASQTILRVFPVKYCPRSITTTLHMDLFNLCKVVQGVLRQHCRRFFVCNFDPRVLKQDLTGFFPAYCCLQLQGQHCTGFNLCKIVQGVLRHHCKKIFPVQSPNTSKTTLHKKISCAMSTQSVQASFCRKITCAIAIYTRQLPVQCWPTVHSIVNVV